jgi:phosphoenolpyruvate carboxylase
MKIQKMSKDDLIKNIEKAENLLNNKRWIRQQTKFWIGVYINHLAKLRNELLKRG